VRENGETGRLRGQNSDRFPELGKEPCSRALTASKIPIHGCVSLGQSLGMDFGTTNEI